MTKAIVQISQKLKILRIHRRLPLREESIKPDTVLIARAIRTLPFIWSENSFSFVSGSRGQIYMITTDKRTTEANVDSWKAGDFLITSWALAHFVHSTNLLDCLPHPHFRLEYVQTQKPPEVIDKMEHFSYEQ